MQPAPRPRTLSSPLRSASHQSFDNLKSQASARFQRYARRLAIYYMPLHASHATWNLGFGSQDAPPSSCYQVYKAVDLVENGKDSSQVIVALKVVNKQLLHRNKKQETVITEKKVDPDR